MEGSALTFVYLGLLLISITGVALLDFRHRLAFAVKPKAAALVLAISTAFFLGWDALGVTLGIFFRGQTELLTGVLIAPEIPLEELFFLILLSYSTLIAFTAIERWRGRKS